MPGRVRLHLDADASSRQLWRALAARGHDVTRTPNDWMARDAGDESQLLGATGQGRAIFTFNVRDFTVLAGLHPQHRGIVLTAQASWTPPELASALDRLLSSANPADLEGQIVWLNRWQSGQQGS